MRNLRTFACIILILALTACVPAFAAEGKCSIVCTSFPCYDAARAVVGDQAEIQLLIKPGAEVHSFEPTPSDILSMADCDLFVYVGGESDAWVTDILSSFGGDAHRTLRFFDCVEGIEAEHDHGAEAEHHDEVEYDEHIWTSPMIAKDLLYVVCNAIIEADPANATIYRKNADAYAAELKALHQDFTAYFSEPEHQILLFADKFPLQYFANAYGLHCYAAFSGCSSDTEPSMATISHLMELAEEHQLSKVYYFEVSSPSVAEVIGEQTGAEPTVFQSCHTVTQTDFDNGETYVSLMRRNLQALQR